MAGGVLTAKQAPAGPAPPRRSVCAPTAGAFSTKRTNHKMEASMEPRMIGLQKTHRLEVEALEERISPSNANFPPGQFPSGNLLALSFGVGNPTTGSIHGILAITPPISQASLQTIQLRQECQVTARTGEAIIGHALKTASVRPRPTPSDGDVIIG